MFIDQIHEDLLEDHLEDSSWLFKKSRESGYSGVTPSIQMLLLKFPLKSGAFLVFPPGIPLGVPPRFFKKFLSRIPLGGPPGVSLVGSPTIPLELPPRISRRVPPGIPLTGDSSKKSSEVLPGITLKVLKSRPSEVQEFLEEFLWKFLQ